MDLHRKKKLPHFLYKYVSLDDKRLQWASQTANEHTIYFSSPSSFNDPFDCRLNMDVSDITEDQQYRIIDTLEPDRDPDEKRLEARKLLASAVYQDQGSFRDAMQEVIDEFGVVCLADKPDNILLWSHYAASHTGLCFEFDTSVGFFADAIDVRYESRYPKIPLANLMDNPEAAAIEMLFTKAKDWEYESEWRLIETNDGQGSIEFPAMALTGIVLGCKISNDSQEVVENWCEGKKAVRLRRAVLDQRSFAINIQDTNWPTAAACG